MKRVSAARCAAETRFFALACVVRQGKKAADATGARCQISQLRGRAEVLDWGRVEGLEPEQVRELEREQAQALEPEQVRELEREQAQALEPEQVQVPYREQVGALEVQPMTDRILQECEQASHWLG